MINTKENPIDLNLFDDIEMSPNSERNPIANSILPPEDIQRNINLTVQNPEVQNAGGRH